MVTTDKHTAKAAKLRALQEAFSTQLPDRLMTIRQTWAELQQHPEAEAQRRELYLLIHSLAGAAGTFGYHRVGEQARQLEESLLKQAQTVYNQAKSAATIDGVLRQLEALAANGPDSTCESAPKIAPLPAAAATRDRMLVYVLEDDALLAQAIVDQLEHFGYTAESFPTAKRIILAQERHAADALILDIGLSEGALNGARIAPQLQALGSHTVPLIFISARADWHARLAALRAGGRAYFAKPLDFPVLVECLDQMVGHKIEQPFRVLIVEDTALLAQHYATVLQAADMETEIVNKPERLLDAISTFGPDIIMMDLHMPQCSGTEAAQIIRQHSIYKNLPIVYLSTESALHEQLNALRMGGDDFLQKPISDAHLVAAVSIRTQRFRGLNALMTCDSLTGLLNHISLKLSLERELALARRRGGSLTFAMLDIDHFKLVNDRYGHPVGDRVIKSLARLLTQRLRKSDIAGRYGGEEFAVILPDTGPQTAHGMLDELRERFAEMVYSHETGDYKVSFSAGIASAPPHADMESIIKLADAALYEAKRTGRNRIVLEHADRGRHS